MVTYILNTQGTATAGLRVQSKACLKQNLLRKVLRSSQPGSETTTHQQCRTDSVLTEVFTTDHCLSGSLQKAASPETGAFWTVMLSLARNVIPGLASQTPACITRSLVYLESVKIINMFETISCCPVSI